MTNKTPEYTRKAIDKYKKSKYQVLAALPPEYKELIKTTGLSGNAFLNVAAKNELTRRGLLNAADDIQEASQRAAETPPEDNAPQLPPGLECPF